MCRQALSRSQLGEGAAFHLSPFTPSSSSGFIGQEVYLRQSLSPRTQSAPKSYILQESAPVPPAQGIVSPAFVSLPLANAFPLKPVGTYPVLGAYVITRAGLNLLTEHPRRCHNAVSLFPRPPRMSFIPKTAGYIC